MIPIFCTFLILFYISEVSLLDNTAGYKSRNAREDSNNDIVIFGFDVMEWTLVAFDAKIQILCCISQLCENS